MTEYSPKALIIGQRRSPASNTPAECDALQKEFLTPATIQNGMASDDESPSSYIGRFRAAAKGAQISVWHRRPEILQIDSIN